MATRNLARTAIEGGRSSHNRYAEATDDRSERRAYRDYCQRARFDEDAPEPRDLDTGWETGKRSREFDDKLRPVRRWLAKQIGRPWNKVHAEVVAKFPATTTAGRHILEHVRGYVTLPRDPWAVAYANVNAEGVYRARSRFVNHRYTQLYVDRLGILREEK